MPDCSQRPRRMLRQILRGAAILVVASLSDAAHAEITVSPVARGYDIAITEQTSSTALIDSMAAALGVTVQGYPADSTVSKTQIRGASLERALRALLPEARFVVRFNDDDTPAAIIFLSSGEGGGAEVDGDTATDSEGLPDPASEPDMDSAPDFLGGAEPEPDMQP